MPDGLIKALRIVSEPTRVRLLLLLQREELSVAELQEIVGKGQSQISTHLGQLKSAGLISDRREGKNVFYRAADKPVSQLLPILRSALSEIPEAGDDEAGLKLTLKKRADRVRSYFDEVAGKFGREYVPGRSWKGLAEALLALLPPLVIADLGAGEGTFSQLLATRAKRVIAVDNSEKMVQFGAALARKHGIRNLEYRCGDLEKLPLKAGEADVAFFSQALHHAPHPAQAVAEAWRILRRGGRIVILDLLRHQFEKARELYADRWLGFTELELRRFLEEADFRKISSSRVHREAEAPHFETILVLGEKV